AYVPVRERRRLEPSELRDISSRWHWPSSHCVSTFPVGAGVVEAMRASGVAADHGVGSDEHGRLWALLCESVPLSTAGQPACLGRSRRPSGLRTSTFDAGTSRRLGLHLDSWDRMPLLRRHTARVRVCVNLGRRARSLLFLPYDIRSVVDALEAASAQPHA